MDKNLEETKREMAEMEPAEFYLRNVLPRAWSGEVSEEVKTLVAGNIRGYHSWLRKNYTVRPHEVKNPPRVKGDNPKA